MINPRYSIRKWLLAELMTGVLFTLIAGFYAGFDGVKSAALGGLTYMIPNVYRTYCAFRYYGARAARSILKGFYQGEMVKFALSVVIFAVVFTMFTVRPGIFFGTYIGMQMIIWFAPLLFTVKVG